MASQIRKPKAGSGPPLTVVWRRIEVLRPDPASPRSHSPTQVSQLARSIRSFGFNVPILIDPTLRAVPRGALWIEREANKNEAGTTYAVLRLTSGFVELEASDASQARYGSFQPRGTLRFNLTDQYVAEVDEASAHKEHELLEV